jgi:ribosomal protein L16 Arg81 hydroxylase
MPGDVLYIPPGYYHSPATMSAASLHYTLTIEPACFWRDFNNRLFEVMLANNQFFLEDYRFLDEDERIKLFERCLQLSNQIDFEK